MEVKEITSEMYMALKKELPIEAVKQHPTKTYLSSIKAIYVTERLNDVFGCGSWQIRAEKISENATGMVVVKTILTIPLYGVYYESFGGNDNGGENSKNFDLGDAYKGATTDGITKIGSYLGIGISVFQGKGNVPPKKEPVKPSFLDKDKAIKEMDEVKNLSEITVVWKKYVGLQSDVEFIEATKNAGLKYPKTEQDGTNVSK